MPLGSLILILTSVTLSALAQIAFKVGVSSSLEAANPAILGPFANLLSPFVLVGLGLYGVGAFVWLAALSRVELSQAYPFVGLGFALTTFAGWCFFGDQISAPRLVGIALIFGGIVLVARS
jgi:multidrug transporter EmrE-like cation transporter